MTSWSRIAALPAAAMTIFVLDGCGGDKATLATFAPNLAGPRAHTQHHADR